MADRRDRRRSFVVLGLSRTGIETKIKSGSVGWDPPDASAPLDGSTLRGPMAKVKTGVRKLADFGGIKGSPLHS